jgi:hypothetical protein
MGQPELFELNFDRHCGRITRYRRGLGLPDSEREILLADLGSWI